MDNQFNFLNDILKENNSHITSGFQSIVKQLQDVSKMQQQNLLQSKPFLRAMENSQRNMNLLGQNIFQNQKNLLKNISIQNNYNFTGVLSLQNRLNDIARNQNKAFNSIARQLAGQVNASNLRFSHSFQTVTKIISDQRIGIPNHIVQEFREFSELVATNIEEGEHVDEIIESVDNLGVYYNDESIKKYTFGEVIYTIIFYISFVLALHNFITNADDDIIYNQEEIIKIQQKIVNKIEQNGVLLEKVYKIDSTELRSFLVTQKLLKVRVKPNDSSAIIFELNANAVIEVLGKKENFVRIKLFDFENHKTIEGWILTGNCISLEQYIER